MKRRKVLCLLTIIYIINFLSLLYADPPDGYYDSAIGKTGWDLKTALYNIIKGHTSLGYDGLWDAYPDTDKRPDNGKVWDMYSDIPGGTPPYLFDFGDRCGTYSGEGDCYNREHTIPKSWWGGSTGAPQGNDLFLVVPTDGYVNNKRGNYPYGEVNSPTWTSLNGSKLGPNSLSGYSGTAFEPIDPYKGDFARGYFYAATRYQPTIGNWTSGNGSHVIISGSTTQVFKDWALNMFKRWHTLDWVSKKETDRNDVIYTKYQYNRNPFIDHPEWVFTIWGDISTAGNGAGVCSLNPSSVSPSQTFNLTLKFSNNSSYTLSTVHIKFPSGFSGISSSSVTISTGVKTISGNLIIVSAFLLRAGQVLTVTINNLHAPSSPGSYTITNKSIGYKSGTPVPIASSPALIVANSGNGMGTAQIFPSSVNGGTTFVLTNKFVNDSSYPIGSISITVPPEFTGWNESSVMVSAGTKSVSGNVIYVNGLNLGYNQSVYVTINGITAPTSGGNYIFTNKSADVSGGILTPISQSPYIHVEETTGPAGDGTGTASVFPQDVRVNSITNITFTIKAGNYNLEDVNIAVPSIWTGLSNATVTASAGTVSINDTNIFVDNINITSGGEGTVSIQNIHTPVSQVTSYFVIMTKAVGGTTLKPISTFPFIRVWERIPPSAVTLYSPIVDGNQISLRWSKYTGNDFDHYLLCFDTSPYSNYNDYSYRLAFFDINRTNYIIKGLEYGKKYYFAVVVFNPEGEPGFLSNIETAEPVISESGGESNDEVLVYPNPIIGENIVQFPQVAELKSEGKNVIVKIYTLNGKLIDTISSSEWNIRGKSIGTGLYMAIIEVDGEIKYKGKFVILR